MKRILFSLCLAVNFIIMLAAPPSKMDISISYGLGTHPAFMSEKEPMQMKGWDELNFKGFPGAISLQSMFNLNHQLSVGCIAIYDLSNYQLSTDTHTINIYNNHISVLPAVRYYYTNKEHYAIYSKAAVGLTFRIPYDKGDYGMSGAIESETTIGIQLTALGFEAGNSFIRAFSEIGYGCQGLLHIGIKLNL